MIKKADKKISKDQLYTLIGALVVVIIGIVIFQNNNNKQPDEEAQANKAGGYTLTQEEAENYCQDANLIGNYFDLNKIDVLASPLKADQPANQYFPEDFGYDKDKNSIIHLIWRGWDETTDESLLFHCYVSGGSKDSIKLHNLSVVDANGTKVDLYGDLNFTKYNKDGEEIK